MRRKVLTHPSSAEEHPVMCHTRLMACLLSGSSSEHKEYLQRVHCDLEHSACAKKIAALLPIANVVP
ncbi:hypothetical protein E2C01_063680 [Portunus trituberculatus]|uniref:Uncharacterized protein n=1 Tax=Portunus trituberculatus TaxID=210409 RepID=A0A5B7HIT4_PORTR|nr:hypothetical protein [Portunus trituberculatus]